MPNSGVFCTGCCEKSTFSANKKKTMLIGFFGLQAEMGGIPAGRDLDHGE
jgi:hypothetical protein